jgi:hypothetical protein
VLRVREEQVGSDGQECRIARSLRAMRLDSIKGIHRKAPIR